MLGTPPLDIDVSSFSGAWSLGFGVYVALPFQSWRPVPYLAVTSARSIVLIGMMGAGKSSVGRCLERRTGLPRLDTDEIVSAHFRKTISEIFSELGEEQFRVAETKALANLAPLEPAIVVTGGGIVLRQENVRQLRRLGVVVWLDADEDTLFERATRKRNRPLLNTADPRSTLSKIYGERSSLYAAASDVRVDTTKRTHEEVAELILSEIETRMAAIS
jgi:shikimate kinase